MQGIYAIKDIVAQQFGPPIAARTDMAASRIFIRMLQQPSMEAADFELYHLGTWDEETGELKVHTPVKITPVYDRKAGLEEVMP